MIALPAALWSPFIQMNPAQFALTGQDWAALVTLKRLLGKKGGERNPCLEIVQMLILIRVVHNSYSGSLMQAQILLK